MLVLFVPVPLHDLTSMGLEIKTPKRYYQFRCKVLKLYQFMELINIKLYPPPLMENKLKHTSSFSMVASAIVRTSS